MKVAFVASEATPYAKTGGLADVVGTLPQVLKKFDIRTKVFIPKYKGIDAKFVREFNVNVIKRHRVRVYKDSDFYFFDCPEFFGREGLYGTGDVDYPDNCERFTLFCKSVIEFIKNEDFDIIHCHDWQTGLIPLYIKHYKIGLKSIFTIHNLGYQGRFPKKKFPGLGIGKEYLHPEGIEFYGDINFLKAGILYSDWTTTVSENYAREIQSAKYGCGLDGILRKRRDRILGILNGLDYHIWNPQTDNLIFLKYNDYRGKVINRENLIDESSIDGRGPLIGMVSRIAGQKGFDLLIKVIDDIINLGFEFILLGFGEEKYHKKLKEFERIYPNKISINIKFDNRLAHRIYAGSDFFLMPSRYEPCGLGQLISLRYGTVPIVRKTGGLADTISEFNERDGSGNGFLFEEYSAKAMLSALERAYEVYLNKDLFRILSENCTKYDFSWQRSAERYKKLYESLIANRNC
jgi:starch synthase